MPKNTSKRPAEPKQDAERYDSGDFNYQDYWTGREYEDAAEKMAIAKLLKGKHFDHAVDVGGGYGRLCVYLEEFADRVTLAEPSVQQLKLAEKFLANHPRIDQRRVTAADLGFADNSVDLVTIVRILHHIPSPAVEFKEIARILTPDGYFLMEFANYGHARNRLKHILRGKSLPKEPVDIRSKENQNDNEPPFVNHNPRTVIKQLAHAGLKVEKVLSVSNLRSPGLKKIMPKGLMLTLENLMQSSLAKSYFGPSIFFLIRKAK